MKFYKIGRDTEIARNNEIAQKNERLENNEIRKNQDFVKNLRKIAFEHQCEIESNFRAIYTRNVRKSLAQLLHDFRTNNFNWKP